MFTCTIVSSIPLISEDYAEINHLSFNGLKSALNILHIEA